LSGELAALLSALAWAISSVLLTAGAKRLHVIPLNLIRCVVSAGFFLALLPFFGGFAALAEIPASHYIYLLISVLGLLVVGDTLFYRSMDLAGVSWAMPVSNINPLWAVLLAALLLGESLTWPVALGAALVVGGTILISSTSRAAVPGDELRRRARRTGLLLALAASVLWGIGQVALKPGTEGVDPIVVNSLRQPMGALILLGVFVVRGQWGEFRALDRRSWSIILLASLLSAGVATLFFVIAVQKAGAGRASILNASAPVMALPFSILWLRERPTIRTVFGTLLTIAGLALVIWASAT
jgi:drug/metabolite transporter (DMT)-like permease